MMSDPDLIGVTNDDDGLAEFRAFLQHREAELENIISAINAEFNATLKLTCMECPVQIEGEIDGLALYFRSRWESWRLSIATDRDSAIRAHRIADATFYHESCAGLSAFDASWMEPAQLDKALRACLAAFREGKPHAGYVEL
jgi:hypothetical protein